ncbi:MAG: hypothetical protein IH804_07375 [Planctomycetes bacterium]|nr:hypothetical protein [Planctomycetota bacterium]
MEPHAPPQQPDPILNQLQLLVAGQGEGGIDLRLNSVHAAVLSERSHALATFALTGFANFGSVGVILGGIGGMAPERRADLARLASRALLAGFCATLINAAIASMLL